MDPKTPGTPNVDLQDAEDIESDDKGDEVDGYHKFLAEMVLFGNLHGKFGEGGFPILSKLGLDGGSSETLPLPATKGSATVDQSDPDLQYPVKNDRADTAFLKTLAQNSDRFGDFNIQAFLEAKKDFWNSKINAEIQDYELDLDFGTQEFQRRFYAKYILVNSPKFRSEQEKAENLKIKMVVSERNILFISRSRLDTLLSDFRRIYGSYCKLRSYLTPNCTQKFERIFEFFDYVLMQEMVTESLEIKEGETDFEVKWRRGKPVPFAAKGDEFTDPVFFKEVLFSYFKKSVFEAMRAFTELDRLRDEKVLSYLVRQNLAFFEFMLKYEKQIKETEIQKEKVKK